MDTVERDWLARPALEVAPELLGLLLVTVDGRVARIVEVEAYGGLDDDASHAARGPTARNRTMWGSPGHLYVYFSYGVHWCANVVCQPAGVAGAVLLRAAAPEDGLERMRAARWRGQRRQDDRDLCRGPGRLCQALGLDARHDGADLLSGAAGIHLVADGTPPPRQVTVTPRVGISRAAELPARFAVAASPWVSLPRPRRATVAGGGDTARRRPTGGA